MPSPAHKIGTVCHEWDYGAKKCAQAIDVMQVDGTMSVHYVGKLATDADGAPRAYHPADKKRPDNTGKAFDWLANISTSELHGIQGQDGNGPATGFYVSGTAMENSNYKVNDTRRYVDASTIPYIVLPRTIPLPAGIQLKDSCIAYVVDLKTGGTTGAIFGDVGHAVGEASIALGVRLGLSPFSTKWPPKVIGFQSGADTTRFFYLLFPTVAVPGPWPVQDIQDEAEKQFQLWGGEAQFKALYPTAPKLKPPVVPQNGSPPLVS